jgi:hypothetical protein
VRKWELFKKRGTGGVVFDGTRLYTQSERKLLRRSMEASISSWGSMG